MRTALYIFSFLVFMVVSGCEAQAATNCEKIKNSLEPFQLVLQELSKSPGTGEKQTKTILQVYRSNGGYFVNISSSGKFLTKIAGRFNFATKTHSAADGKDKRSSSTIAGGIKDFYREKKDFEYESTSSFDGGKYVSKSKNMGKYLGEDDINVGVCFFHVVRFKVTRYKEKNGSLEPINESILDYSPDL